MGCAPCLDDSGWCGSEIAPSSCKQRRYSGCDWIAISPGTAKVFVRMLQSHQNPSQFIPDQVPVQIKMYREGINCVIAEYPAWQRDSKGYVGFYFDDALLAQAAGYYVGDVFLGCDYCFSLKFRLAPCELIVDDCRVENQVETCGAEICAIYSAIGEGVVGGGPDCPASPPCSPCDDTCGAVPPFFDDSNPNDFEFDPCQAGCINRESDFDCGALINPVGGTVVGWY
jgi:hypothetical protein